MRNAVGPMDYTPGPMISMQPELYSALRPNSAGVGTRAFQLATFVLLRVDCKCWLTIRLITEK